MQTKYLNINEANTEKVSKKKTSNATTQTERNTDFNKNFHPDSKKTSDGYVVR